MYASEGDSGYVARLGQGWESGQPTSPPADDATAGVARRLQGRLDRHLWLLDRIAEEPRADSPDLTELLDTAARMRRDTESLLLLSGHEPGVRATGPRGIDELMADAAALAEEPRRVQVGAAPAATVRSAAAVEFLHVLAELVDHATAAYPGVRLELVARIESGGVSVDLLVENAAHNDPDGSGWRRPAAAAEQLAERSRHGIALHRPLGGPPPAGAGVLAGVHAPAAVVTIPLPPPTEVRATRTGGFPQYTGGSDPLGIGAGRDDRYRDDQYRDDRHLDDFGRDFGDGLAASASGSGRGGGFQGFDGFGGFGRSDRIDAADDTGGWAGTAPAARGGTDDRNGRADADPLGGTGGFAGLGDRNGRADADPLGGTGGFAAFGDRNGRADSDPLGGTNGFGGLGGRNGRADADPLGGTGGFGAVDDRNGRSGDQLGGRNGFGGLGGRNGRADADPLGGTGGFGSVDDRNGRADADPLGGTGSFGVPDIDTSTSPNGIPGLGALGGSTRNGSTYGAETSTGASPSPPLDMPSYPPPSSSQVDELFGPLLDLPLDPIDDRYATPIFEAIASAWFKEDDGIRDDQGGPLDWETPQDDEWRQAAARAARSEPLQTTTTSGLPRRRPGNQLVPPPRTQSAPAATTERVPDRIRERLSTYQRGLRQGRHRAPGEQPGLADW